MHVIVVGDGDDAMVALGGEQNFVRDRPAERANAPAAQVGELTKLSGVRRSDTQHLAKLIIRKGDSVAGPARGRVFDAAQSDVGVAPGDRLIDRRERDLDEAGLAAESACDELGDLDIEADDAGRVGWIGFDIRRAAFGVTGPSEKRWGL